MSSDEAVKLAITAGLPTIAVILGIVRNEFALASLGRRIDNLEARLDARITSLEERITSLEARLDKRIDTLAIRVEHLDRDLREWARIVMNHNTDIARLKDKAGIE